MQFSLTITGDLGELAEIAEALSGSGFEPAAGATSAGNEAAAPRRGRRSRAQIAADEAAAGVQSRIDAQTNQPSTQGGPTAEAVAANLTPGTQLTAEQTKAVDPSIVAAQNASEPPGVAKAEVSPTPGAGSPGQPTYDDLKTKMTTILQQKSATVAQACIKDATGGVHSSLTTLMRDNPDMAGAVMAKFDEALLG